MARGVNKVILVGNLGQDPNVKATQSGTSVVNVSLATNESWKDRNSGEQQQRTEWHRLVFFGRLAEIAGQYLKKGNQIYAEGRLQTRKWQGQDGQDRYTTEIVVNEMQMLGGRDNASSGANPFDQSAPQPSTPAPQPAPAAAGNQGAATGPSDNFDDDIPF